VSEREKARAALVVLDRIDAKRREQLRLQQEMRRSLQEQAYDQRRKRAGFSPSGHTATRSNGPHACGQCGWEFVTGEEVLEYFDDADRVIARYHAFPEECRRATERHPDTELLYP
jgi:hypothetical protein